ncbi:MAG: hypothetical protein COT89_01145 [Candidatus Colwellbacteria bacterium CG10_big_fil_rev_8_21_14_0_10_42_22]|uniref:Small ribosomal subunit protein bS6 n=1 Tax=Candidatus Colwellbacteria bacterium CG10_big_fil_rev_8_21_14_0_10_42_22 TaxID=1974540 RepID=A0A2H0VG39_9BACT|nr:MAG: hypothetical protein COT89_01145 [Candidatus Colwellbacteria bacterium CG10_big_fil_rev_8_21_14_0_10_42_22]
METKEKKDYEISFLAYGEEGAGAVVKHLNALGIEILNEGQIESITLAYPIKKHTTAHFGYIYFKSSADLIEQLKEALKFEKGILRHLIVTPPIREEDQSVPKEQKTVEEDNINRAEKSEKPLSNEDLEAKLEEISESLLEDA